MRNAALTLGVIGGIIGMIVGFFSYGYVTFFESYGEPGDLDWLLGDAGLIKVTSFLAPILAIAGGAMARSQAAVGGICLLLSAAGMHYAFGFNVFTMFPIGMCGLAGLLALAARQPDAV